jgi:hypothetical protein
MVLTHPNQSYLVSTLMQTLEWIQIPVALLVDSGEHGNWSSKLQSWVTLSTTEAEYVATVDAGKEAVWMRNLLSELGYKFDSPSVLHMDNNSAIAVAKNTERFSCVKQIDLRLYWLKEAVEEGVVKPQYCPTGDMPADLLTKVLAPVKVSHWRKLMGLDSAKLKGSLERCAPSKGNFGCSVVSTLSYYFIALYGHFLSLLPHKCSLPHSRYM